MKDGAPSDHRVLSFWWAMHVVDGLLIKGLGACVPLFSFSSGFPQRLARGMLLQCMCVYVHAKGLWKCVCLVSGLPLSFSLEWTSGLQGASLRGNKSFRPDIIFISLEIILVRVLCQCPLTFIRKALSGNVGFFFFCVLIIYSSNLFWLFPHGSLTYPFIIFRYLSP